MDNLSLCPLCYSDQVRLVHLYGNFYIKCPCSLEIGPYPTKEDAIKAWHIRPMNTIPPKEPGLYPIVILVEVMPKAKEGSNSIIFNDKLIGFINAPRKNLKAIWGNRIEED